MASKCSNCGEENVYRTERVTARGFYLYGPDLLPGLGQFTMPATFDVTVCADCGYTQLFADQKARRQLATSKKWRRV